MTNSWLYRLTGEIRSIACDRCVDIATTLSTTGGEESNQRRLQSAITDQISAKSDDVIKVEGQTTLQGVDPFDEHGNHCSGVLFVALLYMKIGNCELEIALYDVFLSSLFEHFIVTFTAVNGGCK